MYASEKRLVRPVESAMLTSCDASTLICPTRLESSPALYCLKKAAGRDSTRIIDAASTEIFSFVVIRADTKPFTTSNTRDESVTQIMNIAIPRSTCALPEPSTSENSFWLSLGIIIPTPVTAAMAMQSITTSDTDICSSR